MTADHRLSKLERECLPVMPEVRPERDLDAELAELTYARDLGLFTDTGQVDHRLAPRPEEWTPRDDPRHTLTADCPKCWERAHNRLGLFTAYVRQLLTEVPEAAALGAQEPPHWMSNLQADHGWTHLAATGGACMTWEDACDLIADRGAPWGGAA